MLDGRPNDETAAKQCRNNECHTGYPEYVPEYANNSDERRNDDRHDGQ